MPSITDKTPSELYAISPLALHLARLALSVENQILSQLYEAQLEAIIQASVGDNKKNQKDLAVIHALHCTQIAWGINAENAKHFLYQVQNMEKPQEDKVKPFEKLSEWFFDQEALSIHMAESNASDNDIAEKLLSVSDEAAYNQSRQTLDAVLKNLPEDAASRKASNLVLTLNHIKETEETLPKLKEVSQKTITLLASDPSRKAEKEKACLKLAESVKKTHWGYALGGSMLSLMGVAMTGGAITLAFLLLLHSGGASSAALPALFSALSTSLESMAANLAILNAATVATMGASGLGFASNGLWFFNQRHEKGSSNQLAKSMKLFADTIEPQTSLR